MSPLCANALAERQATDKWQTVIVNGKLMTNGPALVILPARLVAGFHARFTRTQKHVIATSGQRNILARFASQGKFRSFRARLMVIRRIAIFRPRDESYSAYRSDREAIELSQDHIQRLSPSATSSFRLLRHRGDVEVFCPFGTGPRPKRKLLPLPIEQRV